MSRLGGWDGGIGRWGIEGGEGGYVAVEEPRDEWGAAEGNGFWCKEADGNRRVGSDAGRNEVDISAAIA